MNNIKDINSILDVLDLHLSHSCKKVNTPCGEQLTKFGYRIKSINVFEGGANIEVYLCDRATREHDEVRGKDLVQFIVRYIESEGHYEVEAV